MFCEHKTTYNMTPRVQQLLEIAQQFARIAKLGVVGTQEILEAMLYQDEGPAINVLHDARCLNKLRKWLDIDPKRDICQVK